MEEKIKQFLKVGNGNGYGSGSGSGYGYGDGSGFGYGYGDGDGSGSGSGYGDGSGYGYGSGDGSGYGSGDGFGDGSSDGSGSGSGVGSGYGSGYGSGDGSGNGSGVMSFNDEKVFYVDGVATVFDNIRKNVAKGFILNKVLTLTPCYIAKSGNYFAHGETLRKAVSDAERKSCSEKNLKKDRNIRAMSFINGTVN